MISMVSSAKKCHKCTDVIQYISCFHTLWFKLHRGLQNSSLLLFMSDTFHTEAGQGHICLSLHKTPLHIWRQKGFWYKYMYTDDWHVCVLQDGCTWQGVWNASPLSWCPSRWWPYPSTCTSPWACTTSVWCWPCASWPSYLVSIPEILNSWVFFIIIVPSQ